MNKPDNVTPLKIADAERGLRHVFVRDLLLDAHIGVYKHEYGSAQPIRVNVDLSVSETPHGDALDNVGSTTVTEELARIDCEAKL